MQGISGTALMLFQDDMGERTHDIHLAMIFLGIIALFFLVQALGVVVAGLFAAKLFARVDAIATKAEKRTGPMLDKVNTLMTDLKPKIDAISENVQHISATLKVKVDEVGDTVTQINKTVQEVNGRTRTQMARADGIVTNALVATQEISESVQQSIRTPVRQIAGLVAGVKAGLQTLIERSPFLGRGGSGRSHDDM